MRRRRVVFLAAHLLSPRIASGGDVLFCEIAARLRARRPDWEICVVAPDFCASTLEPFFERVITFPTSSREGSQGSPLSVAATWIRRLSKTRAALRDAMPDLVHATGDFFVNVFPAYFAHTSLGSAFTSTVHHVNAPPHRRRNDFVVATASFALQRASFLALRRADSVILLNEGVRRELMSIGFRPERLAIVGAGINIDRFPALESTSASRRVLWLNRLEPTKGLFDLPPILSHLPEDIVLDVVGGGPQVFVTRLTDALIKTGVRERCELHGYLPLDSLRDVMRRASVFISCSYEEGWGISIAEALASGLPCVAYDLPSHREIFGDLIVRVPVGDVAAFAEAIVTEMQASQTEELRASRHAAMQSFSFDACAQRQEAVFDRLMVTIPAVSGRV